MTFSDATLIVVGDGGTLSRQVLELAGLLGYGRTEVCEGVPAPGGDPVFVALAESDQRAAIIASLPAARVVNLVHPTAWVSPSARLAHGIFVGPQAVVGMNAEVSVGVVQNALSSIEHDNRIGVGAFLGTGAILCGHVQIGELAMIGGGATLKPGVRVGDRAVIGTGAVVVKDVEADTTCVGNPARPLA